MGGGVWRSMGRNGMGQKDGVWRSEAQEVASIPMNQ
jgi:hypothetical protein